MRGVSLRHYGRMMWLLSPILKILVYLRYLRGKEDRQRLSERWGAGYQQLRPEGRLIWIHAVSVGEAVGARLLAREIRQINADCYILITTNTVSSAQQLASLACQDSHYFHAYQPLDVKSWVEKFLAYWQPDMAIFVESDFWPHLVCCARDSGVDVYFASSQLSASAFARWQNQPALAHALFSAPKQIFCIDGHQKTQFEALASGFGNAKYNSQISLSASLKLPPLQLEPDTSFTQQLTQAASGRMIIIASSTHDGEEALIHTACKEMLHDNRAILVIAPRHPHRGTQIASALSHPPQRSKGASPSATESIYICDTLGELDSLYAVADVIILGASFVAKGGHNPLEASRAAAPILTGPFDEKNKAEIAALVATGMLTRIADVPALHAKLDAIYKRFSQNRPALSQKTIASVNAVMQMRYREAKKIASKMLQSLT